MIWTFFDYVDGGGVNVIRGWLAGIPQPESDEVSAELDTRIDVLGALPLTRWRAPYSVKMTGDDWEGIYEIRLKVNRNQYRVLYCFGPNREQVVLLAGHMKREQLPPSAATEAQNRRAEIHDASHITRHSQ